MLEEVESRKSKVETSEIENHKSQITNVLDLSAPIRVEFKHRGVRLVHVLNRPSQRDWLNYAKGVSTSYEFEGDQIHAEVSGDLEAQGKLWRAVVRSVEGYSGADGRAIAEIYPDSWREKIPASHIELVVRAVAAVRVVSEVESQKSKVESPEIANPVLRGPGERGRQSPIENVFDLDADSQTVELEVEGLDHAPLVHHFRIPNLNEYNKFKRLMADSRIVGGSRYLKTIMFSRLPGLVKLYDELIVSIEGYKAGQSPIDNRQSAIDQMDSIHKQVAVQALFEPPIEQSAVGSQQKAESEER